MGRDRLDRIAERVIELRHLKCKCQKPDLKMDVEATVNGNVVLNFKCQNRGCRYSKRVTQSISSIQSVR